MSTPVATFQLRQAAVSIYLPTLLFSAGEAAFIPIVPVIAQNVGASLATAGLVAGMLTLGIVMGDIPSGWVISRIGERRAMLWSTLIALLGSGLALAATTPLMLGAGIFLIGLATSAFALARHAFLTSFVPTPYRARALSTLGGMFRAGAVLGPLLSSGVLALTGNPLAAFWLMAFFTLAAGAVILFMTDPEKSFGAVHMVHDNAGRELTPGELEVEEETYGLFATVSRNWRVLSQLGVASALIMALRAGRSVIFPLWAVSIGIKDADTALIIGLATAVDFALFFTSGHIMDRWGRMASIVPSMAVMSLALLLLSLTHDLSGNVMWFIAMAFLFALGNGIGAGIVLTLSSDLADKKNPAPFLGAWRFVTDSGAAIAPMGIAAITAAVSLSAAAALTGVAGVVGIVMMLVFVPRYIPKHIHQR
jgi:MFS family permease